MEQNFELVSDSGKFIITKGGRLLRIYRYPDGDICFATNRENMEITLNFYSRNRLESKCYEAFENLMKLIIGRFILGKDYKSEFSTLPKDFINLENMVITWHSDSGIDNILKLQYADKTVKVSLIGARNNIGGINVRIRTDGSDYEYYYQEFEKFYKSLGCIASRIDKSKISDDAVDIKEKRIFFVRRPWKF